MGNDLFVETEFRVPFHLFGVDFATVRNYFAVKDKIKFFSRSKGTYAHMQGMTFRIPFPKGILELKETFLQNCYDIFDVKGKTVLDIGGFIGDTAIYFAFKGAKKVTAYEPVPSLYEMARENIKLNNFEDIVQIFNEAVSDKEGFTTINYDERLPGKSTICEYYKKEKIMQPKPVNVRAVSFSSVVNKLGHIDLLKMDCEGAEWRIIPQAVTENTLKAVDNIIMEVHWGTIDQMIDLLKKTGFRIGKVTECGKDGWLVIATRVAC